MITIVILSILFLVGSFYFLAKMKGNENFKPKINLIYFILSVMLLSGLALITLVGGKETTIFGGIYLGSLLLGTLHIWLVYRLLIWANKEDFLPVTFFMLLINLLGIIGFYLFSRYVAGSSISLLHSSALLSFIIPFLIHKVFQLELQMPKREYEKWLFPKEFMVMDSDMHEHLIISLYVTKSFGSEVFSKFTIRAPLHQSLGDVFCYFVNGYNQQQIENGIKDLEKNGEERGVGWIFYTKSLLTGMKKVIDPKKTIKENGFREKHVVYTERIHL